MKILHTSDWHIGKQLHNVSLLPDISLFLDHLLDIIRRENIRVLLVSGDIFDQANPSAAARRTYYQFLARAAPLLQMIVITGGNHDSPAVLNAPDELLKALSIRVIGQLPEDWKEMFVPLPGDEVAPSCVIAAVPYLRDGDLRSLVRGESDRDKTEAVRHGIKQLYRQVATLAKKQYGDIPVVAMGHLYTQGAHFSDAMREIQVGHLAAVRAAEIANDFAYMALGHVHRPQTVSKTKPIYYSGSPIALDFSERQDTKRVLIIETDDRPVQVRSLDLPVFRPLLTIQGNLEEVKNQLAAFSEPASPLHALLNVEITETSYNPHIVPDGEQLIEDFNRQHTSQIIRRRFRYENAPTGMSRLYDETVRLTDLKPLEVFKKRIEAEDISAANKKLLIEAFREVYEMVLAEMQDLS